MTTDAATCPHDCPWEEDPWGQLRCSSCWKPLRFNGKRASRQLWSFLAGVSGLVISSLFVLPALKGTVFFWVYLGAAVVVGVPMFLMSLLVLNIVMSEENAARADAHKRAVIRTAAYDELIRIQGRQP